VSKPVRPVKRPPTVVVKPEYEFFSVRGEMSYTVMVRLNDRAGGSKEAVFPLLDVSWSEAAEAVDALKAVLKKRTITLDGRNESRRRIAGFMSQAKRLREDAAKFEAEAEAIRSHFNTKTRRKRKKARGA